MLSTAQQTKTTKAYVLARLTDAGVDLTDANGRAFKTRFDAQFDRLFALFASLYGERDDCVESLVKLIAMAPTKC